MSTLTRRAVAAFLLACGAWAALAPPVVLAAEEKPLSPETILEKKFEGKATVEFTVGEVYLDSKSWSIEDFKSASLRIVPKAAGGKFLGQVSVIVSRETVNRLKQLGIEDLAEHFRGKVLRVSGTVEALVWLRSGPHYTIQINSLDQIEAIRKRMCW
jgi:hypothetical protein